MKSWFVLYTKPKQELRVVDELSKIGINSYCPTVKMIKQYSDRKKKIEKPLIPSYIMVYIEESKRKSKDSKIVFGISKNLKSNITEQFVLFIFSIIFVELGKKEIGPILTISIGGTNSSIKEMFSFNALLSNANIIFLV